MQPVCDAIFYDNAECQILLAGFVDVFRICRWTEEFYPALRYSIDKDLTVAAARSLCNLHVHLEAVKCEREIGAVRLFRSCISAVVTVRRPGIAHRMPAAEHRDRRVVAVES